MKEDEAVRQYGPFVHKTAREFAKMGEKYGVQYEDLVQVGMMTVARCAPYWREDKGASMLTFLWGPVRARMSKLLREAELAGGGQRRAAGKSDYRSLVSLDEPVDTDGARTMHDELGHFEEPPDYFALRQLPDAVSRLPLRERQVIRFRFVDGMTLAETGSQMGLSRERIRQIERDALAKLKRKVKP